MVNGGTKKKQHHKKKGRKTRLAGAVNSVPLGTSRKPREN